MASRREGSGGLGVLERGPAPGLDGGSSTERAETEKEGMMTKAYVKCEGRLAGLRRLELLVGKAWKKQG